VPRRRAWLLAVKVVVTSGLVVWIALNTNWSRFGRTVVEADPRLFWLSVALMPLSYILSAYKWQLLLAIHGVRVPWLRLLRYYLVATFYNNFLPSSIGGDGYRIYKTLDNPRSRAVAVLSVFVDRLSGIFGLLIVLVAAAAVVVWRRDGGDELSRVVLMAGGAVVAGVLVTIAVLARTRIIGRSVRHPRCPAKLRALWEYQRDYLRHPGLGAAAVAVTFVFHANQILFCWLLVKAMPGGASAEVVEIAIIQGLTAIVGILPITINGLGLMDGSFSGLSAYYGIAFETGLAAMLVIRTFQIVVSILGAYVHVTEKQQRPASAPQPWPNPRSSEL
jgi:glycosyltransferase 2 family protein